VPLKDISDILYAWIDDIRNDIKIINRQEAEEYINKSYFIKNCECVWLGGESVLKTDISTATKIIVFSMSSQYSDEPDNK
jgi:hypothetical protein